MFMELQVVILATTVLIAIIGLYFSIRAWSSWVRVDDEVLRARAFLTREFLNRNFVLIFSTGAFVGLHTLLELIEIFGYPPALTQFAQQIRIISFSTLTASMLLLVLLAYYWRKLLSLQKLV